MQQFQFLLYGKQAPMSVSIGGKLINIPRCHLESRLGNLRLLEPLLRLPPVPLRQCQYLARVWAARHAPIYRYRVSNSHAHIQSYTQISLGRCSLR